MTEKESLEYMLQNQQYTYPYHHIPRMDSWRGQRFPSMDTYLFWGFEYLAYNHFVIRKVLENGYTKILDVGCGDGKFLQMLAEELNMNGQVAQMEGIDISEEAIALAKCLNRYKNVIYYAKDIGDVNGQYDCITCIETLEHIPDDIVPNVIANIHRCLKPGGKAIICVPSTNRSKEEKHFRHYTPSVLQNEINESGVPFVVKNVRYFWKKNALKKYLFWTANRFMYIRFRLLDKCLWEKSFNASEKNGAHIIFELEKE